MVWPVRPENPLDDAFEDDALAVVGTGEQSIHRDLHRGRQGRGTEDFQMAGQHDGSEPAGVGHAADFHARAQRKAQFGQGITPKTTRQTCSEVDEDPAGAIVQGAVEIALPDDHAFDFHRHSHGGIGPGKRADVGEVADRFGGRRDRSPRNHSEDEEPQQGERADGRHEAVANGSRIRRQMQGDHGCGRSGENQSGVTPRSPKAHSVISRLPVTHSWMRDLL